MYPTKLTPTQEHVLHDINTRARSYQMGYKPVEILSELGLITLGPIQFAGFRERWCEITPKGKKYLENPASVTAPPRVTTVQRRTLQDLLVKPRPYHNGYAPIVKLLRLGLVEKTGAWSHTHTLYKITPAGKEFLKNVSSPTGNA